MHLPPLHNTGLPVSATGSRCAEQTLQKMLSRVSRSQAVNLRTEFAKDHWQYLLVQRYYAIFMLVKKTSDYLTLTKEKRARRIRLFQGVVRRRPPQFTAIIYHFKWHSARKYQKMPLRISNEILQLVKVVSLLSSQNLIANIRRKLFS